MAVEIVPVHPEKIDLVWGTVEPWLERALRHGPQLYTTTAIHDECAAKTRVLWVAVKDGNETIGFCITTANKYPLTSVLDVNWTGGKKNSGEDWLDQMIGTLKDFALRYIDGPVRLGGGGRPGWIRKYGFKDIGVLFEMELRA